MHVEAAKAVVAVVIYLALRADVWIAAASNHARNAEYRAPHAAMLPLFLGERLLKVAAALHENVTRIRR